VLVREPKVPQYHRMTTSAVIFAVLLAIFYYATISFPANSSFAETGVGKGTFKVVVSIFGITKETGDIVAIVNVDGNSRVKTFDLNPANPSTYSTTNGDVLKFVATFPNVDVESGDIYRACIVKLNDMHHYCQERKNSSAKGSEIVDIVLDKKMKRPDLEKNNEVKNEIKNEIKNEVKIEAKNILPNYPAK
jgi:monomeric isocitrate dehydrogenase